MRPKHEICDSKCLPISVLYEVAATEVKTLHLKLSDMKKVKIFFLEISILKIHPSKDKCFIFFFLFLKLSYNHFILVFKYVS